MNEPHSNESPDIHMNNNSNKNEPEGARTVILTAYFLYAFSLVTGITLIAGIMMAYMKRDDYFGTLYADHTTWLIRTFWYTLLLIVIGVLTAYIIIGFPILIFTVIWFIYRLVKGFLAINEKKGLYAFK